MKMNRRKFIKRSTMACAAVALLPGHLPAQAEKSAAAASSGAEKLVDLGGAPHSNMFIGAEYMSSMIKMLDECAKAGLKSYAPYTVGETAFGIDYTRSLNLPTGRDKGYSVAAAAVQQFEEYGTEFYLLYRLHSLDRDVAPGVHDISVGSIGARVKF